MLKAAFFSRQLARPVDQLTSSRVQFLASQVPQDRRNFSNFSCKNFSNPRSCPTTNVLTFLKPIVASQVTFRPISSEVDVSLTNVNEAAATVLSEPTFHSLGLAHHYPSGWLQAVMEQIHLQFELPWWATIIVTTAAIRLILFPVVVKAQKNMIALNHVLPEFQRRQAHTLDPNLTKEERLRAHAEFRRFMNENNVNPMVTYIPMFCQAGVFMSMFFALRGMANCPVESMSSGGLLWFVDLTVKDPFYALPILTCSSILIHLKLGADGVDLDSMQKTMRNVLLCLPIISLPVMCQFPTALNVYWLTTNLISITQSRILRLEPIRQKLGIGKMIIWQEKDLPMNQMSIFAKLQEAQTVKRQQSEAQLGSQFGPYDWKIREAEMREKAKRERAEKEGKK